jgi:hypothetical protein
MARRTVSSGETDLEALEKIKGRECHEGVQQCAVKGVCD